MDNSKLFIFPKLKQFVIETAILTIESIVVFLLLASPLFIHVLLLQFRETPNDTNILPIYFSERSGWTRCAPNVAIVCTDAKEYRNKLRKLKIKWEKIQPKVWDITKLIMAIVVVITCVLVVCKTVV